jgi:methylmalonyl-CoA/ethylmalonyl-CoA epimerase
MKDGELIQVAYLVRDLNAAMKRHWDVCRIGPWHVYTFEAPEVRDYVYRGRPATHTCLIAVTKGPGIQQELIQPVRGRSIYDEFLDAKGEGLHHVKLFYSDCAQAVAEYARRGYQVIQSGKFDEDEHYYLDTEKDFGYVLELGNAGRIRDSDRRYPM